MHTTQFPALVHCIFLVATVFPSRQPAKHRPVWRILVPIFMIQRCLNFVDTFEALIYYIIRWYKLKKGGPTLSVDSPNIDQHKKSALHFAARRFLVHHVGANPNTFVYPGGIGITRLLTRK